MVRRLDYYTGPIFEVTATDYPGSIASGGCYDGLVAKLDGLDLPTCGVRSESNVSSRFQTADEAVQRGNSGEQTRVPIAQVGAYLQSLLNSST